MKNTTFISILFTVSLFACGKQTEVVTLEKTSPAYALGKTLSSTLPIMDPDSNQILVKTNVFRISAGEVLDFVKSMYGSQAEGLSRMEKQQLSDFMKRTTMQLIEKKLLLRVAQKANVDVTPSAVDSLLNAQYVRAGGEEQFLDFLKNNEIDIEFVKQDVENSLIINSYLRGIVEQRCQITEEQIQEAYQAFIQDTVVDVRHILLMTRDKSDAEKKEIRDQLENILKRARGGEDFSALAKQYSEDPGSKENGGLYEDVTRGVMVKPFEDAAFSVPPGELSDIVETQYGYHILKIVDRKTNDKPLEEERSELEEKLRGPESETIIVDHIEELKKEVELEILNF
jgi:parvulin-like peptidyl-prolyl isomerase